MDFGPWWEFPKLLRGWTQLKVENTAFAPSNHPQMLLPKESLFENLTILTKQNGLELTLNSYSMYSGPMYIFKHMVAMQSNKNTVPGFHGDNAVI